MTRRRTNAIQQMNTLDRAAGAALALGALNWGLVGAANFDAVRAAFGKTAARAVYGAVAGSAVYAMVRGRQLAAR